MYREPSKSWTKHIDFMLVDFICVIVSYVSAYIIRNGFVFPTASQLYKNMFLVILMSVLLMYFLSEIFSNVRKRGLYAEFIKTTKHIIALTLIWSFYLFATANASAYSRTVLFLTSIFYFVFSYLTRVLWKQVLFKLADKNSSTRSLMIITRSEFAERIISNIKNNNYEGFKIAGIGILGSNNIGDEIMGIPVVSSNDEIVNFVCRGWVDEVFINDSFTNNLTTELVSKFDEMGITTHYRILHADEMNSTQRFVEKIGKYTVLTTTIKTARLKDIVIKRTVDILAGIAGCIITLILCVVIGPIIYIKSPGPIFFYQTRLGKNGRKFKMYKFRSMYLDAEERKKEMMAENQVKDGMMFKVKWDKRIIGSEKGEGKGIGNFIRKYSLDEFPQFFNVLMGDMSLIGTRPPTLDEWEKYQAHHRVRLAIKPGITGMWQISGRSDITDFESVVELDKKYITEWSIGLDIKIILKTILVVFKKDGAM